MNLKIAQNSLVFKITKKELVQLVDNKNLNSFLKIDQQKIEIIIKILKQKQIINNCQSMALEFKIKNNSALIKLLLNEQTVQTLLAMGKNKQGICFEQNNLKINVQIDTRYY